MELTYNDYCFDPRGGFRQKDLIVTQVYDQAYLDQRYKDIDAQVVALSEKRMRVLSAFVPMPDRLLDFGCGAGRFVRAAQQSGWGASGYDIALPEFSRFSPRPNGYEVVTFFDSLEHLPDPAGTIAALAPAVVMISVPECHYPNFPAWFMAWKHRRPGEHLWHWNRRSLDKFMRGFGYRLVLHSWFEDKFRPYPEQSEPNILTAIYHKE